jgi:nitrite reductase (cytochrome c-552)
MENLRNTIRRKPWLGWVLFLLTVVVVFALGLLASSVMERRTEAIYLNQQKVNIQTLDPRNEVWGQNYPREFESYYQTKDTTFRSKYNGNAKIDALERYPNMVILWAGYAFAGDYTQPRGHYYAVDDIVETLRTGAPMGPDDGPQPATCWTCKSPDVPRLMSQMGVKEFYSAKWAKLGSEVVNPIGCADCHDEKNMSLKITRPALVEAFERQGKDITKASHQEMRSLVCAQCHVEYYFDKKTPEAQGVAYLTFPWDKGTSVDDMEAYYDNIEFSDWTHKLSRAPMLKAQHPDYEVFQMGIHAQRGVSCADCHMPYKSEGGVKFTDHHIQSPLNNVSNSCQVCHRQSEKELIGNVYANMDRVAENREILEFLLARTHIEAKFAWDKGATEAQMKDILKDIRRAQWRWDFAVAGNGSAAHAPVEVLRMMGKGISLAQDARVKLSGLLVKLGHEGEVPMPDVSTKEKAQAYIGLPMEKMKTEKEQFLQTIVPQWVEEGKAREAKLPVYNNVSVNK